MIDYMERQIRMVACGGCGEPAGVPCKDYPSGKTVQRSHNVRFYSALEAGMLPFTGYPVNHLSTLDC